MRGTRLPRPQLPPAGPGGHRSRLRGEPRPGSSRRVGVLPHPRGEGLAAPRPEPCPRRLPHAPHAPRARGTAVRRAAVEEDPSRRRPRRRPLAGRQPSLSPRPTRPPTPRPPPQGLARARLAAMPRCGRSTSAVLAFDPLAATSAVAAAAEPPAAAVAPNDAALSGVGEAPSSAPPRPPPRPCMALTSAPSLPPRSLYGWQ